MPTLTSTHIRAQRLSSNVAVLWGSFPALQTATKDLGEGTLGCSSPSAATSWFALLNSESFRVNVVADVRFAQTCLHPDKLTQLYHTLPDASFRLRQPLPLR